MNQQAEAAAAAVAGCKDLYAALGLTSSASDVDIKKAYREQALRWHPDKAGISTDAKQRFQAISEAYEILADGEGRRWYDHFRFTAAPPPPPPRSPTGSWGTGTFTTGRARANSASEAYAQAYAQANARMYPQGYTQGQANARMYPQGYTQGYAYAPGYGATGSPGMAYHQTSPGFQRRTSAKADVSPPSPPNVQQAPPTPSSSSRAAPEGMRRAATARSFPQAQGWQQSQSQRPTAAEVHPEGFDQPDFLATLGDLRALATFLYGGRRWQPQQVFDVDWGRNTLKPREMRLNFSAEYLMPPSVARSAPEFDLQRNAVREVVTAAFKAHLKELLGSSVQSTSSLSVSPPLGPGNGLKTGSVPFIFKISLEGEPGYVLSSFRRARATGPAMKSKDCPIM